MKHQVKTVGSILAHRKSFVLDDPGTGKTNAAIWAMQGWFEHKEVRRVLIVAPLSIVHGVWKASLFFHTDWAVADLTKKTRDVRLRLANDKRYQVIISNPQVLHNLIDQLPDVDAIIVDECTAFKSHGSRQTKALQKIVDTQDNPYLVMMTGTPAPQGPEDAYRLIKFVNPRAEKLTFRAWRDMTMVQITEFKWIPKKTAQQTLIDWLQPGTRTSREQALDLPPLRTYERHYELTRDQVKAIKQMRDDALAMVNGEEISAANAAVAASKALQILTGYVKVASGVDETRTVELDASSWFDAIEEIVHERHEPVLIFVPYRAAAHQLGAHLKCPVVTGNVPQEQRQEIYRQINEQKVEAVVAVAQTMSHGLTLTGSNCVLWALPPIGAEQYQQGNARVYRNGQSKPVDIIHLIGHNFVQALFARTDERVKLQQAVLDALALI
jgi:SNF2 family DNA or RNA helicase